VGGVQVDINIGDRPCVLDPIKVRWLQNDLASGWAIEHLFLGLVNLDNETGEPVPELATLWEVSKDATVWTFTLRDDVTWTDGRLVTAEDAQYGILHILNPALNAPAAYTLYIIKNAEGYNTGTVEDPNSVGIEALDDTHLQFTLERPASYFPSILTLITARPLPRWAIEEHGEDWTEIENIVTNGPYRLVEWIHDDHITLEKNNAYYAAQNVQIERVVMWMVDEETAWEKYQAGFLDTTSVLSELLEDVVEGSTLSREVQIVKHDEGHLTPCMYYYGFNTAQPPFDNVLVRKAFIAAVARGGVMKAAASAGRMPFPELALTLVPPGISDHVNGEEEGIGIPYNPEQAQEWLAEAGYPDGAGIAPITLWFNDSVPQHKAIAEYIRQNWIDNLGVTVELHSMPWRKYLNQLNSGQCQIWRLGWCADYSDAHSFLHDALLGDNRLRLGDWSNQKFDSLLDEASRELDPKIRRGLYKQAEKILVETDAVIMPLFYYGSAIATKPYLQRTFPSFGAPDIAKWRLLPEDDHLP